jgi:hypothetical protein
MFTPVHCFKRSLWTFVLLFLTVVPATTQAQPSLQLRASAVKTHNEQTKQGCTNNGTYINKKGQVVPRPETCSSAPQGATAQCRDRTYSFSQHRSGTCSYHGGVAKWL